MRDFGIQLSLIIIVIGVFLSSRSGAMPDPSSVQAGKPSSPISAGALHGGQSADGFSLLDVQLRKEVSGGQKLILSYGDRNGQPAHGEPGFFHAVLDRSGRRLVIDLAQMTKTAIDPRKLSQTLSASPLVASSEMTMDPIDGSTNISIALKTPVLVSVKTEAGSPAQLVFDIKPAAGGAK